MTAAAEAISEERLVVSRTLRVAVGEDARIIEVPAGDPWPAEAVGRVDLLIKTGHVIRFGEDGQLDPRSFEHARRLGIEPPQTYPTRMFHQRARALAQMVSIDGRRIRVFAGRPDGAVADLFVAAGRAYAVRRGAPDTPAAREAVRSSAGGNGRSPRRRASGGKKRRRKLTE